MMNLIYNHNIINYNNSIKINIHNNAHLIYYKKKKLIASPKNAILNKFNLKNKLNNISKS